MMYEGCATSTNSTRIEASYDTHRDTLIYLLLPLLPLLGTWIRRKSRILIQINARTSSIDLHYALRQGVNVSDDARLVYGEGHGIVRPIQPLSLSLECACVALKTLSRTMYESHAYSIQFIDIYRQ